MNPSSHLHRPLAASAEKGKSLLVSHWFKKQLEIALPKPIKPFPLGEGNGHTPQDTSSSCRGGWLASKLVEKPSHEGKIPGQATGSHSSRFEPGFVWAVLAASEHFWAFSLQCSSPPEV